MLFLVLEPFRLSCTLRFYLFFDNFAVECTLLNFDVRKFRRIHQAQVSATFWILILIGKFSPKRRLLNFEHIGQRFATWSNPLPFVFFTGTTVGQLSCLPSLRKGRFAEKIEKECSVA